MASKADSTGQAVVDPHYHYKPIDKDTPRGQKLILIRKADGCATIGPYNPAHGFDHYAPLPTFLEDKPCQDGSNS